MIVEYIQWAIVIALVAAFIYNVSSPWKLPPED